MRTRGMAGFATLGRAALFVAMQASCSPRLPSKTPEHAKCAPHPSFQSVATWHRAPGIGRWQTVETQAYGVAWIPPNTEDPDDFDGAIWRAGTRVVAVDARVERGRRALEAVDASVGVVLDLESLADPELMSLLGELAVVSSLE